MPSHPRTGQHIICSSLFLYYSVLFCFFYRKRVEKGLIFGFSVVLSCYFGIALLALFRIRVRVGVRAKVRVRVGIGVIAASAFFLGFC